MKYSVLQEMADSCVTRSRHLEIDIAQQTVHIRLIAGAVTGIIGVSMWRENIHPLWGVFILALGLAVVLGALWLLSGERTGLAISAEGLSINSKVGTGGYVSWLDVSALSLRRIGSDLYLLVRVHQPERHIKTHRAVARPLLRCCNTMYDTPVLIDVALLDCDADELLQRAHTAFDATFAKIKR